MLTGIVVSSTDFGVRGLENQLHHFLIFFSLVLNTDNFISHSFSLILCFFPSLFFAFYLLSFKLRYNSFIIRCLMLNAIPINFYLCYARPMFGVYA